MSEPLPIIRGRPITRDEVIEGLREVYQEWCKHEAREHCVESTRLPDYETVLDYIETHGLPPKGEV